MDCVRDAKKSAAASHGPIRSVLGFPVARGAAKVTIAIIAINVAVFLFAPSVLGNYAMQQLSLFPGLDAFPAGVTFSPEVGEQPYRWVTSGFAHGGIIHLGMNMLVLFMVGSQVEKVLGRLRYVLLYSVSLLGSSALVMLVGGPTVDPSVPGGLALNYHLGASGAIFGVIAAFLLIRYTLRMNVRNDLIFYGAWVVLGVAIPGVSWEGHVGGVIAGALVAFVLLRTRRSR